MFITLNKRHNNYVVTIIFFSYWIDNAVMAGLVLPSEFEKKAYIIKQIRRQNCQLESIIPLSSLGRKCLKA